MKLIAFDPSGNWGKEGMGNTGICVMADGVVKELTVISAKNFSSEVEYWDAHVDYICQEHPDHVVMEGYKLYNHKGTKAEMQANSELQTPQLIGVLKSWCHHLGIPYSVQFASDVKSRWQEPILVHLGYLEAENGFHYWNGKRTVTHQRDALKHALHFTKYKAGKL
jgi:hypothetical protein